MPIAKTLTALCLSLLLSGCFHAQLGGSVAGATLTIAPLESPDNIVIGPIETWDSQPWIDVLGQTAWDEYGGFLQMVLMGIAQPNTSALDPDQLYLVTMNGGQDYDPNSELALSDTPAQVQGSWHAIISGKRIKKGNIKVSALTEALYQQNQGVIGTLSNDTILHRLDAATALLLDDTTKDEIVNYDDALRWSRSLDEDKFRGDLAALDALAAAVRAAQPDSNVAALARQSRGSQRALISTNFGDIELETLDSISPITVANFVAYIEQNFYDEVIFHRTINNFMIQTGGWVLTGPNSVAPKATGAPIVNESSNGVSNRRGTVAMARTSNPDSATAQFFINQSPTDNLFLDYDFANNQPGYAVFAWVTSGMSVVDTIAALPTTAISGIGSDVPSQIVKIESITLGD